MGSTLKYEIITADGGVTRYTYNTQMERVAVTNAAGLTWRFEYDLDEEVIKETDYNGLSAKLHAEIHRTAAWPLCSCGCENEFLSLE